MPRRFFTRAAVTAALGILPLVALCTPAEAWSWSAQVTLTGTVKVIYHPGITGVYVSGSDGEHGWATLGAGNSYSRAYWFKFYHVPGGSGIHVNWTVHTSNGNFSNNFGLARPRTGANAVRDLCDFTTGC